MKQLEATGLFYATKDGVNKVIESDYSGLELYEKIKEYMTSPVRTIGYVNKADITADMVIEQRTLSQNGTIRTNDRCWSCCVAGYE